MSTNDDLLRPSLDNPDTVQNAIYSTTAGYLTAFIGGPFAAITMAGLNSWRLRRLARDALPIISATALSVTLYALFIRPEWFGQVDFDVTMQNARLGARVYALMLFGAFWLLHKRYYRAAGLMGLKSPSPWVGGVACVLVGTLATFLLARLLAP